MTAIEDRHTRFLTSIRPRLDNLAPLMVSEHGRGFWTVLDPPRDGADSRVAFLPEGPGLAALESSELAEVVAELLARYDPAYVAPPDLPGPFDPVRDHLLVIFEDGRAYLYRLGQRPARDQAPADDHPPRLSGPRRRDGDRLQVLVAQPRGDAAAGLIMDALLAHRRGPARRRLLLWRRRRRLELTPSESSHSMLAAWWPTSEGADLAQRLEVAPLNIVIRDGWLVHDARRNRDTEPALKAARNDHQQARSLANNLRRRFAGKLRQPGHHRGWAVPFSGTARPGRQR